MIKIIVIDDHRLFLDGMRYLLARLDDEVDVCTCSNVQAAIDRFDAGERFTLGMVDLAMPGMDGFSFLRALKERHIHCPIVMVSATTESEAIRRALREGALGFIPKYAPGEVMLDGLRQVLGGEVFLPEALWLQINGQPIHRGQADEGPPQVDETGLGDRQLQVLELMARGLTNKQISTTLAISEATVKYHVGILFRALQVKSRTACIHEAQSRKLIPRDAS